MSPAKRGSLAGLQPVPAAPPPLPARPAASPADTQTPEQRTPEVRSSEVQTPEAVRPKGVRQAAAPEPRPPAEVPGLPKYLRLERKELLIWPDQITKLSILARVLNRNRRGAGERITTNTLIRVAVALLLRPGGHDGERTPQFAGTPGLTDSGFPRPRTRSRPCHLPRSPLTR